MSIVNNCMVVSLHVSAWSGYRQDKEAAAKVVRDAGAQDSSAARVNKHLIPKEALADVGRASSALRNFHYQRTLPWKDNGDRLLVKKQYHAFMLEFETLKAEFDQAADEFSAKKYPAIRDQAEFRLGKLFKADDFPRVGDIRRRFSARLDLDAISTAQDFRLDLDKKAMERIQRDAEEALNRRMATAMEDVWARLATSLERFADRMKDVDGRLHASTVQNLEELVDLLPDLNIVNDPRLNEMAARIKESVCGYEPDMIRKDKNLRKSLGGDAQKIIDDMKGFMSAFGVAA